MSEWLDVVRQIVATTWYDTQTPFLLVNLRAAMASRGYDIGALLQGRKLRIVISTEAQGILRLVPHPEDELTWGVVPWEVSDKEAKAAFPALRHGTQRRYKPGFWAAFSRGLPADKFRVLMPGAAARHHDLNIGDPVPHGALEVGADYIVSRDVTPGPERDTAILSKIDKWARDKGVDLAHYIVHPLKKVPTSEALGSPEGQTALDMVISLLTPSEMRRVSMPLDVIAKLATVRLKKE